MAGGANAGSGFAGFGKGLASVLLMNRERQDQKRREDQAKADRALQYQLPIWMKIGEETGDWTPLEQGFGTAFPEMAKTWKKEPLGARLGQLAPLLTQDQQAMQAEQESAVAAGSGEPQVLPSRQPVQAVAPRKTLFGVELPTDEEKAGRAANIEAAQMKRLIEARRKIAESLGWDPARTTDYAAFGTRPPVTSSEPYQSVAGELPDGTQVMATFDQSKGIYIDPTTRQPLDGFRRSSTTGSASLGQYAERASIELGFGRASQVRDPEKMRQINERAIALQAEAAGQTATARGAATADVPLNTQQRFTAIMSLQDDWRRAEAPQREMQRQLQIMDIGLRRFQGVQADGTPDPAGPDRVGGSEAVRVTFEKILDPTSVVREGEYARQGTGLSLLQRMEAFYQKYGTGGGEIPAPVLASMVETARQFVAGLEDWNAIERQRIEETAKYFGLDPSRVFGVAAAADRLEQQRGGASAGTGAATGGTAPPAATTPSKPYKDAQGNWVIP